LPGCPAPGRRRTASQLHFRPLPAQPVRITITQTEGFAQATHDHRTRHVSFSFRGWVALRDILGSVR
jgi:hypothetical protein